MRFTFDRDAMIKEIAIAQEIISTKNAMSILSNILLIAENNTLYIKATDIKVNFETKIPVVIDEEGSTTIFCDKFMSILSNLPSGEIEFIQNDIKVTIKPMTKKVKFDLKSMASDKFPEFSSTENVPFFEVPADQLKQMIEQTIFAISDDETRYFLTGVLFEKKGDNQGKYRKGNYFLDYLQLHQVEGTAVVDETYAVGGNLGAIFKESQSPTEENDRNQRPSVRNLHLLQFQVPIPCESHEHIRCEQQEYRI